METTDPVAFFDGNDRVLNLMNMRRGALATQSQADQIKNTLCNKIQELCGARLRDRIVAIDLIDPELSAYIAALESINAGIWCGKCKSVKSLGAPIDGPISVSADTHTSTQSLEASKLSAHLASAREELSLLAAEYGAMKNRMELLTIKLDSYGTRISAMSGTEKSQVPAEKSQVQTKETLLRSYVQHTKEEPRPKHALLDLTREDLPPAPEYDLHIEIGDLSASADSLLE